MIMSHDIPIISYYMCRVVYRDWKLLGTTGDSSTIDQDTLVLFLVCNYSFVFVVDMSPSMAAVVRFIV